MNRLLRPRRSVRKILSVVIAINLFLVAPAHAALMKLFFKGSITSLSSGYAIPGIDLGDEVAGELIFDPATSDTQQIPFIGLYSDAIKDLNLSIGNRNFSMLQPPPAPATEIVVKNDEFVSGRYYDSLFFRAAVVDQATQEIRFFQLTFSQSGVIQPTVLASDALAASIDLNAFEGRTGFLTFMPPGASQGSNITLTLLSLDPVSGSLITRGDVNGDLKVNLADAILAMQIVSDLIPSGTEYKSADVNGDGKIGMAEVIYILQKLAWTRQN